MKSPALPGNCGWQGGADDTAAIPVGNSAPAWSRRRREMRGNVEPTAKAATAFSGWKMLLTNQLRAFYSQKLRQWERNDEEFPGHRFQCTPDRGGCADAATGGNAGPDQGQGGRRLPRRPANLGRGLSSRPGTQAALAQGPRRVA